MLDFLLTRTSATVGTGTVPNTLGTVLVPVGIPKPNYGTGNIPSSPFLLRFAHFPGTSLKINISLTLIKINLEAASSDTKRGRFL